MTPIGEKCTIIMGLKLYRMVNLPCQVVSACLRTSLVGGCLGCQGGGPNQERIVWESHLSEFSTLCTYTHAYWTHVCYGQCTYTLMYTLTCLVSTLKGTPKLDFLSEVCTYVLAIGTGCHTYVVYMN